MALWVRLEGLAKPLPAASIALERELGRPVVWVYSVHVSPERRGSDDIPSVARLLEAGPVHVQALAGDTAENVLGGEGTVVEVARQLDTTLQSQATQLTERPDRIVIRAHASGVDESSNPFSPKRRVHHAENLLELANSFKNVATLTRGVANHFQTIQFPDGRRSCVVQDGISDWDFFSRILGHYTLLESNCHRKPLVMIGSVDTSNGTAGRFVVNWATPDAYRQLGDVTARTIHFGESDYDEPTLFGEHRGIALNGFSSGVYPVVVRQKRRSFAESVWNDWSSRDVPLFMADREECFIFKVSDQLFSTNHSEDPVAWTTAIWTLPKGLPAGSGEHDPILRAWMGLGVVEEHSPKGPWIKVRLRDFEREYDFVDARVSSPYSGEGGTKGFHMVPEKGTTVLLGWSGYFGQPIIAIVNAREQESGFDSPSLWLESPATYKLEDVDVKGIGDVRVRSRLDVKVDRPMQLNADGTDVKMQGGIFFTGR